MPSVVICGARSGRFPAICSGRAKPHEMNIIAESNTVSNMDLYVYSVRIFSSLFLTICVAYVYSWHQYRKYKFPPSPPGRLPVIGHSHLLPKLFPGDKTKEWGIHVNVLSDYSRTVRLRNDVQYGARERNHERFYSLKGRFLPVRSRLSVTMLLNLYTGILISNV
jgi:hypothetical protein